MYTLMKYILLFYIFKKQDYFLFAFFSYFLLQVIANIIIAKFIIFQTKSMNNFIRNLTLYFSEISFFSLISIKLFSSLAKNF